MYFALNKLNRTMIDQDTLFPLNNIINHDKVTFNQHYYNKLINLLIEIVL